MDLTNHDADAGDKKDVQRQVSVETPVQPLELDYYGLPKLRTREALLAFYRWKAQTPFSIDVHCHPAGRAGFDHGPQGFQYSVDLSEFVEPIPVDTKAWEEEIDRYLACPRFKTLRWQRTLDKRGIVLQQLCEMIERRLKGLGWKEFITVMPSDQLSAHAMIADNEDGFFTSLWRCFTCRDYRSTNFSLHSKVRWRQWNIASDLIFEKLMDRVVIPRTDKLHHF